MKKGSKPPTLRQVLKRIRGGQIKVQYLFRSHECLCVIGPRDKYGWYDTDIYALTGSRSVTAFRSLEGAIRGCKRRAAEYQKETKNHYLLKKVLKELLDTL